MEQTLKLKSVFLARQTTDETHIGHVVENKRAIRMTARGHQANPISKHRIHPSCGSLLFSALARALSLRACLL